MRCRPAESADVADVARLLGEFRDWWGYSSPSNEAIEGMVGRMIGDRATDFLVAIDDDGAAVGVAQLRYRLSVWTLGEDCWLEDLYVTENARGSGAGRALMETAVERARARGCKRMELDVNEQNTAALAFYEQLGFTTTPKPPGRTLFISRWL
jgi:ribosomal protein S18 acetylase RimI-like enzyme